MRQAHGGTLKTKKERRASTTLSISNMKSRLEVSDGGVTLGEFTVAVAFFGAEIHVNVACACTAYAHDNVTIF
jgi:hypothetical protein